MADLEIRVVPDDVENFPSLDEVAGVERVERRLVVPGLIDSGGLGKLPVTVIGQDLTRPRLINRSAVLSGESLDPARAQECLADRSMYNYNDVDVGDRLRVMIGADGYDIVIRGIVRNPEFLLASASSNFFLPTKGSSGLLYCPLALISDQLGFQLVNSILFDFSAGADAQRLIGEPHTGPATCSHESSQVMTESRKTGV